MSHPQDHTDPRPALPSAPDDPFALELDLPPLVPPTDPRPEPAATAAPAQPVAARRPAPDPAAAAWLRELRGETDAVPGTASPAAPRPDPGFDPEPPRRPVPPAMRAVPTERPLHQGRPALPSDADRPPRPSVPFEPVASPAAASPDAPGDEGPEEAPAPAADERPVTDRERERLGARRRRDEDREETPRWLYALWAAGGLTVIVVALLALAPDATGAFIGDLVRDLPGAPGRLLELMGTVIHVLTGGR